MGERERERERRTRIDMGVQDEKVDVLRWFVITTVTRRLLRPVKVHCEAGAAADLEVEYNLRREK